MVLQGPIKSDRNRTFPNSESNRLRRAAPSLNLDVGPVDDRTKRITSGMNGYDITESIAYQYQTPSQLPDSASCPEVSFGIVVCEERISVLFLLEPGIIGSFGREDVARRRLERHGDDGKFGYWEALSSRRRIFPQPRSLSSASLSSSARKGFAITPLNPYLRKSDITGSLL